LFDEIFNQFMTENNRGQLAEVIDAAVDVAFNGFQKSVR
jgi:hypothetical protein